jgi:iron-sulfur cluster repair protein YtfE (RIC family)
MEALTLLVADHNRVRGLVSRFKSASEDDDIETMAELAAKMREELEVHTTIEEEIFYPGVQELSDDLAEVVAEGIQEHHEVEVMLEELEGLASDDPAWKAKWTVITENVEHHAEEEESEMFPGVRKNASSEWLEDMGERLDRRKGELGAPTLDDRIDLTSDEVQQLASEQEIPGRSKMSADELRATVSPG